MNPTDRKEKAIKRIIEMKAQKSGNPIWAALDDTLYDTMLDIARENDSRQPKCSDQYKWAIKSAFDMMRRATCSQLSNIPEVKEHKDDLAYMERIVRKNDGWKYQDEFPPTIYLEKGFLKVGGSRYQEYENWEEGENWLDDSKASQDNYWLKGGD